MQDSVHKWPMLDSTSETIRSICQPLLEAMIIGGTALAESGTGNVKQGLRLCWGVGVRFLARDLFKGSSQANP